MLRYFIPVAIFAMTAITMQPLSIYAEDVSSDPSWKSNVELGAVQTSGNTHTLTVNAKVKSIYDSDDWRATIAGNAINSSANNATTAEKYDTNIQGDWKFSQRDYLFMRLGFESDRFTGYKQRTSETIGYGRQLIKTATLEWKSDIGGGLRQSKLVNKASITDAIVRAATSAAWQFSESSKLTEDINTEGGGKGWTSKSVSALQTSLNSHLSSKISFSLTHNSVVPVNTKKLDVETAITLVVNF